jgi:glycosyltransferase involved in cell wall biosynthesis
MQIDAMEKILADCPNAGLMIVGSGSLENRLRAAIDSKTYRERILLAGDVEHRVTLHLLNNCDILLRTTLFDGDAISVREALFLGTPVIATDNGMRPQGVNLIPMHDADAMTKEIRKLAGQNTVRATPVKDDMSNVEAILELYES